VTCRENEKAVVNTHLVGTGLAPEKMKEKGN
jgi:hypothetical protein